MVMLVVADEQLQMDQQQEAQDWRRCFTPC